ncbi:hypothetical protein [Nocardia gipuzkoensis]|uniref:hypothetical protein n=1 Tax=Nocardia gipuzkoensis TaxID=2749991 RepID=UPI0015EECEE9|nr:hypothetical protein [Nocardia gipuzkoensis]
MSQPRWALPRIAIALPVAAHSSLPPAEPLPAEPVVARPPADPLDAVPHAPQSTDAREILERIHFTS